MAILTARSWDCGNTMLNHKDYIIGSGGSLVTSVVQAHTGTYSLKLLARNPSWARWAIGGTPTNPSISVWLYPFQEMYDGVNIYLRFLLGTGEYIDLRWTNTNHTFDAYVDGVKVADGTIEIANHSQWVHVQFYCVIADAGSISVLIDGFSSIAYNGDTQPAGATNATYFYLTGVGEYGYVYMDDLVIGSGGLLGDLRCVDIRPNADTAQDDWTPSVGDNYSTIDETPASDVDYNETNVNAQADELALSDFDGVTYTPVAVTAWVRAKMEGATGDSIKVGIDSGGVDDVTEHALSASWEYYFHTNDENPNGPVAWNDAAIDAALLRYKSVIA